MVREMARFGRAQLCQVAVPKERRYLFWGFYFAVGDAGDETQADQGAVGPIVRFYWHLLSGAAAPFVAAATSLLNTAGIPFRLKVLSDPNHFHRADSGLIFVRRHYLPQVSKIVAGIHRNLRSGIRREVPLFTRRLADGLGFAEDPGNAMSFGQHRCHLTARALWDSFARGEVGRDASARALANKFRGEGVDPLRPHLRLDSLEDDTAMPPVPAPVSIQIPADLVGPEAAALAGRAEGSTLSNVDAAMRIGEALCRSAYWDRQASICNWMGRSIAEITEYGGPITPTSAACGPDLYAGSAGIGLYLAELYVHHWRPNIFANCAGRHPPVDRSAGLCASVGGSIATFVSLRPPGRCVCGSEGRFVDRSGRACFAG